MNEIITSLKKTRLEKKLKQSELGEKLGLPQSHVCKIERGRTDPRLSTVMDMARLLGQELVLVPTNKLPLMLALISDEDDQPMWVVDDEEGDE